MRENVVCARHGLHVGRGTLVFRRRGTTVSPDQIRVQQFPSSSHHRHRAVDTVQCGVHAARCHFVMTDRVRNFSWESTSVNANCRIKVSVSGVRTKSPDSENSSPRLFHVLRNIHQWMSRTVKYQC